MRDDFRLLRCSSACQITAAKVMDVSARLPDCAGQAAEAVSACTQVEMKDTPKLPRNSEVRVCRHMDASSTTQVAKIMHGLTLKILRLFLNGICMVTNLQASCGRDNWDMFHWDQERKRYRIGTACLFIENKDSSYRYYVNDIKMAESSI